MYRILIVDDEKIERNGIKFLLKQTGIEFEVHEATNGKSALEYVNENPVDILLTDIKMPFMDGIELVKEVNKLNKNIRMIIFSGYSEFEYARTAMKIGVKNYILKPVDPGEFKHTILEIAKELEQEHSNKVKTEKKEEMIKEHLLYLYVNGSSREELIRMTKGMADIEDLFQYQQVLMVELNEDFFSHITEAFWFELQEDLNVSLLHIDDTSQQSVLLLPFESIDKSTSIARHIHNYIKNKYNKYAYVAVGKPITETYSMQSCMEDLELLMENKFYQLDDYLFLSEEQDDEIQLVQIDDDVLMKQMKQDIRMKDISNLRVHFSQLCEKYKGQKGFSQVYIKFIFSNLLKEFYENLPKIKEQELNDEIDRLYKATDFSCVLEIVEKNIDRLEESFGVNPQMVHREIESVKEYIYEHYNEELGVSQLADKVCMAPSYLSAIFKKETGQNLSKFIKAYRMEKAKDMLENSHSKIVQISEAVGYVNVSYFCQSFREYFGVSPQKFRSQGDVDETTH